MHQDLLDFPRPNVAVDLAVLSVQPSADSGPGRLVTLLLERAEAPAGHVLPGRFIRERETIRQTVDALLAEKLHLPATSVDAELRLLSVFDDPARDERGWTLSIAHMTALPWEDVASADGEWVPVRSNGQLAEHRDLRFDHQSILAEAITGMRDRYEVEPDPDGLLRGPFTLLELRRLHEAVLGERVRKDTFNRRMREQLTETDDEPVSRSVGRPAQQYVQQGAPTVSANDSLWRLPRMT